MASVDDTDLPKAVVKRLAKAALDNLDPSSGDHARGVQVNKDALLALSESTKVFILYLTATATAHKAAAHRQTLLESDVFAALNDIQYPEFLQPLKDEVQALKQKTRAKAKAKAPARQGAAAAAAAAPVAPAVSAEYDEDAEEDNETEEHE